MHNSYYGASSNIDPKNNKTSYPEADLIDLADPTVMPSDVVASAATNNNNTNNTALSPVFSPLDQSEEVTNPVNKNDNTSKAMPIEINISLAELISDEGYQTDLLHLQAYLQRSNARFTQLMNQVTAARMYYQSVMNAYR